MDANSPLLFFDSGVGGLSVLEPTRALLPNAPIVYVADNAGYPYGRRSEQEIASRIPALLGRLVERFRFQGGIKVGYVATSMAGGWLRTVADVVAVLLLLYGGWAVTTGLVARARRKDTDPEVEDREEVHA